MAPRAVAAARLASASMSTVIHPVGSKRPETYWRRRVVALVLLGLVLIAVVFGVKAVLGAVAGAQAADEDLSTSAVSPDPVIATDDPATDVSAPADLSASGPADCAADQLSLVAITDATGYVLGGTARVGMRITNTGDAPCTMDAGSEALELLVVSGEDRIWSSDDCQESAQSQPTTVDPGDAGALESNVEWTLVRSAAGCADDLPDLQAGTYQLTARAGDLTSSPLAFEVT